MDVQPLRAAIFDMDGVLIDSEPIWRRVEVEVFRGVGVPLTEELALETTGLRVNEMVDHWHVRHPWETPDRQEVADRLLASMAEAMGTEAVLRPGALDAIEFFRRKGLRLALASSSFQLLIDPVLDRWGLRDRFETVHSAEHEPLGKPHPGVYLTTAAKLGVPPRACLAVEDSANGVRAAKAAGMMCLAVPESPHDGGFVGADLVLGSLTELDERAWQRLVEAAGRRPEPAE